MFVKYDFRELYKEQNFYNRLLLFQILVCFCTFFSKSKLAVISWLVP